MKHQTINLEFASKGPIMAGFKEISFKIMNTDDIITLVQGMTVVAIIIAIITIISIKAQKEEQEKIKRWRRRKRRK